MNPFEIYALVGVAVLGLLIGSFLNVVIHRLPREGSGPATGRSACPRCEAMIAWYDNIPVVSWVLLGGKCRSCRAPISFRYPLVELITAALITFVAYEFVIRPGEVEDLATWGAAAVRCAFVAALVAATFIDLDFRIIPDVITIPGMALAPVVSLLFPSIHERTTPDEALFWSCFGVAAGGGMIYLVGWLGKKVFKKDAMGFGDVKYMGLVGGILGPDGALLTFLIACVAGSVIGLLVLGFRRSHYMPFAPFLSIGALCVLFFREEIVTFLFETYPSWIR